MKSIYGDVTTLEKDEEEEVARIKEKSLHSAYAESRKRGILQQAEQRVSSSMPLDCMRCESKAMLTTSII